MHLFDLNHIYLSTSLICLLSILYNMSLNLNISKFKYLVHHLLVEQIVHIFLPLFENLFHVFIDFVFQLTQLFFCFFIFFDVLVSFIEIEELLDKNGWVLAFCEKGLFGTSGEIFFDPFHKYELHFILFRVFLINA